MKLAKKILVSTVSGLVILNCYSSVSAVRHGSRVLTYNVTVTRPDSDHRSVLVCNSYTLVERFKGVLKIARGAIDLLQNSAQDEESTRIHRAEINRVFARIYKDIFEPVVEFSSDSYGSRVRSLKRKDFVPLFLIYTDSTEHKQDMERFDGFSKALRCKLRRNGNICRAIDSYSKSSPEFLSDAQAVLENSEQILKRLCDELQGEASDASSPSCDSDESSDHGLFNYFDEQGEPNVDPAPSPSPATEPGSCFTRFFGSIKSIFSGK